MSLMDPTLFITILIGIIQVMLGFFLSTLWGMIRTLENRVNSLDVVLATQRADLEHIKDNVDRMVSLLQNIHGERDG